MPTAISTRSGSPEAVARAHDFQREICTLANRFERFNLRWSSSSAIASNVTLFRGEAAVMIMSIRRRLRREMNDLFLIADALGVTVDTGWSGTRQAVAAG